MALIRKTQHRRDLRKALFAESQQGLRAFDTALHRVALRTKSDRILEAAAKVAGAEAGNAGQLSKGQLSVEIRLDILQHATYALGRQVRLVFS